MKSNTGSACARSYVYSQGLSEGRCSEITVNAFGTKNKMRRFILGQLPYFVAALSPRWLDPSTSETYMHPEEVMTSSP
ncbi:hypothetical protein K470DRAFT_216945 [Piedraia hortae CBS 480.64]|uniref:Uncharacterized protein n=1 Tax=Piedraia hortae CBS 480.64 TaxID=1314780 RepID=A0A6A7BZC5_9PEZI|nr:hypothetical protein K470DRAFT_216945 [Piedraia hortae CBS 480.64]